jgi:NAD(P)-dependent dehydrogenase (short-subunit alcohol dehydrogenase family)
MALVVVSGANRGIGLELCKQLKTRKNEVIALCRKSSKELKSLNIEIVEGIDIRDNDAYLKVVKALDGRTIDLLINNAGILSRESIDDMDYERIRKQFEVNAIGPLRLSLGLLSGFSNPAKLVVITSRMGSIGDNSSGGRYGYRMSKAAVNMAFVSLAQDLRGRGISVAVLHPGFVRTDMTGHQGFIDPPEAASGLIARIDELNLENTGSFWHENGEELPW